MTDRVIDWNKITITNNLMFCTVMKDEKICKEFLETMLHIQIDHLEYIKTEDTITTDILGKGIRLDVHVKDSEREFDLEMQMADTKELPLRARFYQSLLDTSALNRGQLYSDLKERYVVFICAFDLFQENLPVYTFENLCLENLKLKLNDRTHTIFFNINAWDKADDEKIKSVLKYFKNGSVESNLTDEIDSKVIHNRFKRQWREEFMTFEYEMALRHKEGREAQKVEDEIIIRQKDEELIQKDKQINKLLKEIACLKAQSGNNR